MNTLLLQDLIRDIPDFPKPGVIFKDITPLLRSPEGFGQAVISLAEFSKTLGATKIVGVESRGFIFGAPVALNCGQGFVPVRKPGKLPGEVKSVTYQLEYGTDSLEASFDSLEPGERVVVIDDVLASGGTAAATADLVESFGAQVIGFGFLIELEFLSGRDRLAGTPVLSLLTYS